MPTDAGYITAATGSERHLEMAVDLALSLRDFDRRPLSIVVDPENAERIAQNRYSSVFDQVRVAPPEVRHGHGPKLHVGAASPYGRTIFIDSDCIVLRPISSLWDLLDTYTFTILGEYISASDDRRHHNLSTSALCRDFNLERYHFTHSPIFFFDDGEGKHILDDTLRLYLGALRPERYHRWKRSHAPDEVAFGITLGRRDFRGFPAFDPMLEYQTIDAWTAAFAPRPIYHAIVAPPRAPFQWLMGEVNRRRSAAGLAFTSEMHWRAKVRAKRIERFFNRAGRWLSGRADLAR